MLKILGYSGCTISLLGIILAAYAQNIPALIWAFSSTYAWLLCVHLAVERQHALDTLSLLDRSEH
jgi:hypothetical protein